MGVTFAFDISSGATYGDSIGTTGFVPGTNFNDPVLDGLDLGTLTLTFSSPTTFVAFDVMFGGLDSAVNGGNAGGQVAIGATNCGFTTGGGQGTGGLFSIGSFDSTGCGAISPFTVATVTFSVGSSEELTPGNTMFAIDNLSYTTSTTSDSSAPEPGSVFLAAAVGFGLGLPLHDSPVWIFPLRLNFQRLPRLMFLRSVDPKNSLLARQVGKGAQVWAPWPQTSPSRCNISRLRPRLSEEIFTLYFLVRQSPGGTFFSPQIHIPR